MNMDVHLSTMMTKELVDLFQSEIIKSLNQITFNSQRKIISVRKEGNSLSLHVDRDKHYPKHIEIYSFGLASKLSEAECSLTTMIEHLPENRCLYKDSGLWQIRTEDMENVIYSQELNESFSNFIKRVFNAENSLMSL